MRLTGTGLPSVVILAALLAAGCAPRDVVTGGAGLRPMLRTELYFGMSMPGGKAVSEAEWAAFLDAHVTPKFRDGLTVIDASGQCLSDSGEVVREQAKVLVVVHGDTPQSRIDIYNIISAYKRQFRQKSVLRVTEPVGVSF